MIGANSINRDARRLGMKEVEARRQERTDFNLAGLGQITVSNALFHVAVAIFAITTVLSSSRVYDLGAASSVISAFRIVSVYLVTLKLILSLPRCSRAEILGFAIVVLVAAITYVTSKDNRLLFLALFIIAAKGISFESICKTLLPAIGLTTLFVFMLSAIGVISSQVILAYDAATGSIVSRRMLGFVHQNSAGRACAIAYLCFYYLRFKRFSAKEVAISFLLVAFLFFFVISRTPALIVLVATVFAVMHRFIKSKATIHLAAVVAFVFLLLGVLMPFFYNASSELMSTINGLSSNRLRWASLFINNYPVTLFGQNLPLVSTLEARATGQEALVLDNAFIRLLLNFGLLAFIAVISGYVKAFSKGLRCGDSALCVLVALMSMSAFAESWALTFCWCFVLLACVSKTDNRAQKSDTNIAKGEQT